MHYGKIPTFADVEEASKVIEGHVVRTPVMTSSSLNEMLGCEVYFKCENYQKCGAFKIRGGFYAMSKLTEEEKKKGVVAFSLGNHSQAVALSGSMMNIPTTVLMPSDVPPYKIRATQGYGATVKLFDRETEKMEIKFAEDLKEKTNIEPYDNPYVVAGAATVAKELFEEVGELDHLYVPVGGGGLISGCCLSTTALSPDCVIHGVEPTVRDEAKRSLESGKIEEVAIAKNASIADGALTSKIGDLNWHFISRHVTDVVTASDNELIECMKFFSERMKMLVEPTGCLGLSAVKQCKEQLRGKKVGVIISGGNISLKRFLELVGDEEEA